MVNPLKKPPTLIPPDDHDNDECNALPMTSKSSSSSSSRQPSTANNVYCWHRNSNRSTIVSSSSRNNGDSRIGNNRRPQRKERDLAQINVQLFQKSSKLLFDITSAMLYHENEDIIHRMEELLFCDPNDANDSDDVIFDNDNDESMPVYLENGMNVVSSFSASSVLRSNVATAEDTANGDAHGIDVDTYHPGHLQPNGRAEMNDREIWLDQHRFPKRQEHDDTEITGVAFRNNGTRKRKNTQISLSEESSAIMIRAKRLNRMMATVDRIERLHRTLLSDIRACCSTQCTNPSNHRHTTNRKCQHQKTISNGSNTKETGK